MKRTLKVKSPDNLEMRTEAVAWFRGIMAKGYFVQFPEGTELKYCHPERVR